MSHYHLISNSVFGVYEEMRSGLQLAMTDRSNPVFCPKPRRLGSFAAGDSPIRPLRCYPCNSVDAPSPKAGQGPLDLFNPMVGEDLLYQVASSPPFFSGSPPSRVANPVVHDVRFGKDCPITAPSPVHIVELQPALTLPVSPRKSCSTGSKFEPQPALVRIEGFDCLNRNCRPGPGLTAMA